MPFPNKKCLNQVNTCYWFSVWVHDILHTSHADPPLSKVFQSFCKICSFLEAPFIFQSKWEDQGKAILLAVKSNICIFFQTPNGHHLSMPSPFLFAMLCLIKRLHLCQKNLLALQCSTYHSVNIMSNISTCTSTVAIFTMYHENISQLQVFTAIDYHLLLKR